MPSESPTITRISVTSIAIAIMLISERMGRCTRLEIISLFIACRPDCGQARWKGDPRSERLAHEIAVASVFSGAPAVAESVNVGSPVGRALPAPNLEAGATETARR